jgi:predicted O-methyltransferase YrrM
VANLPPLVSEALARAEASGFAHSCEPTVGRLLAVFSAAVPEGGQVLELGTGVGVGTAWLVSGLGRRCDVRVVTVERDRKTQAVARSVGWPAYVEFRAGNAEVLLPELGMFDLVFADAEGGKWTHLERTVAVLRPGAVLIVDDMDPAHHPQPAHLTAIQRVRQGLLSDPRLIGVDVPASSGFIIVTRRRDV